MPKVSKYKLDSDVEREMFRQFWISLAKLRDATSVSAFFSDLLSDTEEIMLAKRFTVAILLLRGKRPTDIAATIHVAYSTIGSVASWLKNAKPHTRKLLQTIIQESSWQTLLDRIDSLLDQMPPRWGSNWQRAGKEKWKRSKERSARTSLR